MSQSADTMQLPIPFEFEGTKYPVAIATFEHELQFTNWLEMRSREKLVRRQNELPPGEYARHMEGWRHDCDADAYEFDGAISWASRFSVSGQKQLCYLLLVSVTPMVTPSLIDRIFANAAKKAELLELYWRSLDITRPRQPVAPPAPPATS